MLLFCVKLFSEGLKKINSTSLSLKKKYVTKLGYNIKNSHN